MTSMSEDMVSVDILEKCHFNYIRDILMQMYMFFSENNYK